MQNVNKLIINFYCLVIFTLVFLGYLIFLESSHNLTVYFLDVGQGDAILIKTPQRHNILIDGGPDNTLVYKLGQYLSFYDRDIDLMILTHPDSDHLVSFVEILKRYNVKRVMLTGVFDDLSVYEAFLNIIHQNNISVLIVDQANKMNLEEDLVFDVLYPFYSLANQQMKINNDSSIVLKLIYNNHSILFTGDATKSIEQAMMEKNFNLKSDILKVGHHGSNTSSGLKFLATVNPSLAIIPVGENKFGHPTPAVLARLAELNIPYLSTLNEGDIIVSFEGDTINID